MRFILLDEPKVLIDNAFRHAKKESGNIRQIRDRLKLKKTIEIKKIDCAANYVLKKLDFAVKEVPSIDSMNPFYKELFELIVESTELKKAMGQMSKIQGIIWELKKRHIVAVKKSRSDKDTGSPRKMFYGRLVSLVNDLDKSIARYNDSIRKLKEMPDIDFEAKTAVIAGYPNVGKTTLLSRLTGSTPKIAEYPFTTQKINISKMTQRNREVQVIDTPGVLDRPFSEMSKIEKKAVLALRHLADAIIFIFDPTEKCGFSIQQQRKLLDEVRKQFEGKKIIIVINKADIASDAEMKKAAEAAGDFFVEGENVSSGLKEAVFSALIVRNKP